VVKWLLVAAFALAGAVALLARPSEQDAPRLTMLDVGQGDSIVIDAGIAVMVGTGNPGSQALAKARARGHAVRALLTSHLHDDHAGDAPAVIASGIAAAFWNGRTGGTLYEKMRVAAADAGVPLVAVVPGDRIRAGGATLQVIGPDRGYLTSGDPNDTSLSIRVELPGFAAILTGDANLEAEEALPPALLRADVLKVGHHGSKTSSGAVFLARVSPRIALVSSGAGNRYGHPAPEALARLRAAGAAVYRTDQAGTMTVTVEGAGLRVLR
jgi:competence protein ComEC